MQMFVFSLRQPNIRTMSTTTLQRRDKLSSFAFKLKRIRKQEQFRLAHQQKFQCLTQREREILRYLAEGYNNPQIGEMLYISRLTVEQHRKNIIRKLKAKSAVELFQYALAFNLV